jgi:hypothetical protein
MTTMKAAAWTLILAIGLVPPAASAQRRGGGGGGGRAAPAGRPAPQTANPSSGGGFNLSHDTGAARSAPATANRTAAGTTHPSTSNVNRTNAQNAAATQNTTNAKTNAANVKANSANVNKANVNTANVNRNTTNVNRNVSGGNTVNVNRTVVANPVYHGPAWGWNGGAVWAPVGRYYGGGFWGALAISATAAAVYGSITNSATNQTYTSYQVQQNSPGSTLLSNYGLTQTQCGPPNLVVIYGPSNSVICAIPNAKVTAGEYTVDPSNLSIVSQ